MRQAIQELSCDYYEQRKVEHRPLGHRFIKIARRHWHRRCISDRSGQELRYGKTLIAASLLARQLTQYTNTETPLGILLPPSVPGALTNIACTLTRQVAVNLNYTTNITMLQTQVEHCNIRQVITSRTFIEKLRIALDTLPFLFIEDLLAQVTSTEKLRATLRARLAPASRLCSLDHFDADETVNMLFSSGSTGQPKAIMLSHHNVLSNLEQMRNVFPLDDHDHLCGVLPLFHCFGLNITLWLPLTSGVSVDFVPNPLDHETVASSVRKSRVTVLTVPPPF